MELKRLGGSESLGGGPEARGFTRPDVTARTAPANDWAGLFRPILIFVRGS